MNIETMLSFQILDNSVERWLEAVMIAFAIILFGRTIQYVL